VKAIPETKNRSNLKKTWWVMATILCLSVPLTVWHVFIPWTAPFAEPIALSNRVRPAPYWLSFFSTSTDGVVWGVDGLQLLRIAADGQSAEPIAKFQAIINGVHVMDNGFLVVATDNDPWDDQVPARVFISSDGGNSFEQILDLGPATALWWSLNSDNLNRLYVGEYGPKDRGQAGRVWRSIDFGQTWEVVFRAPDSAGVHIHRVAVDPYTQDLWVTHGDREDGIYHSTNGGETWKLLRRTQPTAVAFTADDIYWGEDHEAGRVTQWSRQTGKFTQVFEANDQGPYGGSAYDMAAAGKEILVTFMKYPKQRHMASVWSYTKERWTPMLVYGSHSGSNSIGGPDAAGRLYVSGWIIDPE
jgi:hypothetical protein